jgi:hypothetical protein
VSRSASWRAEACRSASWVCALWLLLASPATAGDGGGLRWIYVESNVGGSSGGHLALRIDETIYHVQQGPDGLYELNRDEWDTFRHLYTGLQNRHLHVAAIDVAPHDLERVERRMARAYVAQRAALAEQARLRLDRAWLEAWRTGGEVPALPSAGLLAPTDAPDPEAAAVRARVEEALGRDFVTAERARVEDAIARFDVADGSLLALRERLLLREALRALDEGHSLAAEALLPIEGRMAEPLSAAEREAARQFATAQREAVVELLGSARPDRAGPLLLALARHQALARSARTGRLVLLDPYAGLDANEERESLSPAAAARLAAGIEPVVRAGRDNVLAGRRFDEARYNLLELGAALWQEFEGGVRGRPVRKLPRKATPAAPRTVAFAPATLPPDAIEAAITRTERAIAEDEARLHARYRYGVFERNCVTELVRMLNASFEPDQVAGALGASLEPGAGLSFIPFVFYDEATDRLRVRELEEVPSHRERELARMATTESGLTWRLREATALTSTIYEPRLRDGRFLFFTDDVFWRRPLLGLANLGWALGNALPGLLAAPFDGAARLRAAGSGVWYSLPELAFFNIRKGTFEYVPPD